MRDERRAKGQEAGSRAGVGGQQAADGHGRRRGDDAGYVQRLSAEMSLLRESGVPRAGAHDTDVAETLRKLRNLGIKDEEIEEFNYIIPETR